MELIDKRKNIFFILTKDYNIFKKYISLKLE